MKLTTTKEKVAWNMLVYFVLNNNTCRTGRGYEYRITLMAEAIYFTRKGKTLAVESFSHAQFVKAFQGIKNLAVINSVTIKGHVPYKLSKRGSFFIALLLSSGILCKNKLVCN